MKSTIVLFKKYYRFAQKVLSFCPKSTIVLLKKYYRFVKKSILNGQKMRGHSK